MSGFWVLLVFIASLVALLAVPLDLAYSLRRHEGRQEGSGSLSWLFGLLRFRLNNPRGRPRITQERPKGRRRHRQRRDARRMIAVLRTEGFGLSVLRLIRDLFRLVHIRDLGLYVRMGLDDPADTGRLWAMVGPLAAVLGSVPGARITIEPEFSLQVFEFSGEARIRLVPIQLVFLMLAFMLSVTTLRALRTVWAER